MNRSLTAVVLVGATALAGAAACETGKNGTIDGRQGFERHCAACHPRGGNIVNPARTLDKKTREANGIKSAKDIVGKMRHPGPGMATFDKNSIPDGEAKAIADYIIKSFR